MTAAYGLCKPLPNLKAVGGALNQSSLCNREGHCYAILLLSCDGEHQRSLPLKNIANVRRTVIFAGCFAKQLKLTAKLPVPLSLITKQGLEGAPCPKHLEIDKSG